MKRVFVLLWCAIVMSGCGGGGGGSSSSSPPPATQAPVTESLKFWALDLTTPQPSYYQTTATKVAEGAHCYIYLEQGQTVSQASIDNILTQFDSRIYPGTTAAFGNEPKPGIDNDPKTYVLLLKVRDGFNTETSQSFIAGYFDSINEYSTAQTQYSNQKELFYMNVNPDLAGAFPPGSTSFNKTMAHEFQHLIQWEQKEHQQNLHDDTWLIEAMATVAGTYCGYGPDYRLVYSFERAPTHSLTIWDGTAENYGVVYMWGQYFKDQFGSQNIFYRMLHNNQTGIAEVNAALAEIGSPKDFTATFRDWGVALYTGNGTTVAIPAGHPEWAYTSINTWPGVYDGVPLSGLFPASQQNANISPLASWGLGFYSYTPSSGATGTLTWTSAGGSDKAYFVDSGSGTVNDMVSGSAYNFSNKGYLIAENLAGSTSGTPVAVRGSVLSDGGNVVPASPIGSVKTASEVLAAMNNSQIIREQVAATGKPVHVCIDAALREQEKVLKARGGRPPF